MRDSGWKSKEDTYDRMLALCSSESFLKMNGLGNEVPFYICPFPASEGVAVERMQRQLVNSLEKKNIRVLEIDLYDLVVRLLKESGDWNYYLEKEPGIPKEKLKEDLQGILDVESVLVPEIARLMDQDSFDVLFLSGVGEVFPYIRSHNVLNNLQSKAKSKPTVMFFPGEYTHSLESGASLDLFGLLHDDKYYRAFNIFYCEA
jgi:hypothetical protein